MNEPVISENENNQNSVTDAVARDKSSFYKSRFNVRSVISQVSDINSEEESFYSNPSSSLNSAITSNTRSRRTAATATAAAYTDKKLVPMSKAWVSGRENLSASTFRYRYRLPMPKVKKKL